MSFILANDLSQQATEMDTVSRICSSTFKLGNTSFPPKDTINFRIPRRFKSTAARLFTSIRQSRISSARRSPSISSGNTAKPAHFLCKSAKHWHQQSRVLRYPAGNQTFHAKIELFKSSIQTSHDSRLHPERTSSLFLSPPLL